MPLEESARVKSKSKMIASKEIRRLSLSLSLSL
jgi:hypothetical protein